MSNLQIALQSSLSEDYKYQQNKLKQVKQKLLLQCQLIDDKIKKQLQKIKSASDFINDAAQLQTKTYNQSLNSDNYSTVLIDFNTLSAYLKKQKAYLSNVVSASEQNSKQPKSGKDLLHKLSNRKKMEKYLQHLQCFKLQKEIEYLEKNILIGHGKDGNQNILYEDIQSVILKQENERTERLKTSIQQLERLVGLSNQCGGNINEQYSSKITDLNKQTQRLEIIENMLQNQRKQIVQVKDFFNNYEPKEITKFLSQYRNNLQHKQYNRLSSTTIDTSLQRQEVDFLLNFQTGSSTMKIFKKPFEQVNDLVKICKNKLKKIKT